MSQPPSQEKPPDELMQAYRRASAHDRSAPSERVRASILARSKRRFASAAPAANDSRWKWKAAASLGAVGLAGMLAWQTFFTAPHGAASTQPGPSTEVAPPVAEVAPANAPANAPESSAPSPALTPAPAPVPAPSVAAAARRVAPQAPVAGPAVSAADASRSEAPRAALQSMNAKAAGAAAPALSPRRDQAIAALHAIFPELFAGPAVASTVRVALVLNGDGTVYRIAREDSATAGAADASAQLQHALGIGPDELEAPAQLMALDRNGDQPNTIVVALGVRKNNPGPARDAH